MKIFTTICLIFFSLTAFSASIKIIGPCSAAPFSEKQIVIDDLKTNVGQITVSYLLEEKIPFAGDEFGIGSINNSAVGDDAIEVLSDTELRAYGWCYTINNIIADQMPNDTFLTNYQDSIIWFYAFSTYSMGEWSNYCTPAYTLHSPKFCSLK